MKKRFVQLALYAIFRLIPGIQKSNFLFDLGGRRKVCTEFLKMCYNYRLNKFHWRKIKICNYQ